MGLSSFAKNELERAGFFSKESDYNGELGESVLRMIELFSSEGHSGFSARLAISLFEKLIKYEVLTPLTGEDSEWNKITETLFQNNRCYHVFKENGVAYDSEGIIFQEPDGSQVTDINSRVVINFPYTPIKKIMMRI